MRSGGESLNPALADSSVKQKNMTSIKRGSELRRRALSGILQCLVKYMCLSTHFFFCQWEWVKCIIELIVCNSLSHDENNNTIRPIRTASVL